MKLQFYKYQGTGNDFVMIDNRHEFFPKNDTKLIHKLCDRRFGIGADGLILLESGSSSDFNMVYYNADGNQSSMCGNGGRCIVAFAKKLNIIDKETTFNAVDGLHNATISENGTVALQMKNVEEINIKENFTFLDTGSPHHVAIVDNLENINIKERGAEIRYSELYGEAGSNINFVTQVNSSTFTMRTYERGVEDETLSCGTGATAVAITMFAIGKTKANEITLNVEGGTLKVSFKESEGMYTNVFLIGPATLVFEGSLELENF